MYSPFSENMTTIVNSSAIRVSGLTRGTKLRSYHPAAFGSDQYRARQEAGEEWNPEIDENAFRNLGNRDVHHGALQSELARAEP